MSALRWVVVGVCTLVALGTYATEARASLVQVGEGPVSWELGGYFRSFSVMVEPGLHLPQQETPLARHVDLLRLEHRVSLGARASVEVHNRLGWEQGAAEAAGVGVGVSPAPDRSLSLRSVLIETPTTRLDHDVDRAVLRLWFDRVDLAIGRQAITWGSAVLFAATDFWAPLSPFELDTSQKRGIDAARLLVPLTPTTELELVLADRGRAEDLAAGAKLHHFGAVLDGWVGVARLWEQLHLAGGLRGETAAWTLRAEGTLPVRFQEASLGEGSDVGVRPPRVTAGAERFGSRWILMVEAHFNGEGASRTSDYGVRAAGADLARGETFWLGQAYLGGTLAWLPVPDWTLSGGSFVNLLDVSTLLTAQIQHDVAESVELGLGWYGGVGRSSRLNLEAGSVDFGSEFGLYGHAAFLQIAAFF